MERSSGVSTNPKSANPSVSDETFLLDSLDEALAIWGKYDRRPEAIQRTHEAVAYLAALHGAPSEFRLIESGQYISVAFASHTAARLYIKTGFLQSPEPIPGFVFDPDVSRSRDAFRRYFPEHIDQSARPASVTMQHKHCNACGWANAPAAPECDACGVEL
jgi:hypothetical protein